MDLGRRTRPTASLALGLPLLMLAGACADVPAAACPDGTTLANGELCRRVCSRNDECLLTEVCSASLCLPAPDDMFEIRRFDLAPTRVGSGETIEVRYVVVGATQVQLLVQRTGEEEQLVTTLAEHVGTVGFTDTLASGTLVLRAAREGETLEEGRTFEVDVNPPSVRVDSFTASAIRVAPGEQFTLMWETTGATEVTLTANDEPIPTSGVDGRVTQMITETTNYRLEARNDDGDDAKELTVSVISEEKPVIEAFTTNRGQIDPGDTAALVWQVTGATQVEVKANGQTLYSTMHPRRVESGAWVVQPSQSTQYTLFAYNGRGEAVSDQTTVQVIPLPPVPQLRQVRINPLYSTGQETSATISWNVDASAEITITEIGTGATYTLRNQNSFNVPLMPGDVETRQYLVRSTNARGADDAVVSMFAVTEEQEPNDTTITGNQELANLAVEGVLLNEIVADVDNYKVTMPGPGYIRIVHQQPCDEGVAIALRSEGSLIQQSTSTANTCAQIVTPVEAGTYRLRVSMANGAGPQAMATAYVISAEAIGLPICGDGQVQQGETCDDGGRLNGDGCTGICQLEPGYYYGVGSSMMELPGQGVEVQFEATGADSADDGFIVLPLGFEFPYFGHRYGAVVLHTNGYVSLTPDFYGSPAGIHAPLGAMAPQTTIALFAADLVVPSGVAAGVRVHPVVPDPSGEGIGFSFVGLQFDNDPSSVLSGSLVLSANGRIHAFYTRLVSEDASRTIQAGIENEHGNRVVSLPQCDVDCVANDEISRGSPYVYGPADISNPGN